MAANRWKLTVLELFIIGVLLIAAGATAVWQYKNARDRERLEIMKDDLRLLATAQEAYAADNAGMFMPGNPRVTTTLQHYGYAPSRGVTVSIAEPGARGWSATATHARLPGWMCGIFVGDSAPAPPNPALDPGEPYCG